MDKSLRELIANLQTSEAQEFVQDLINIGTTSDDIFNEVMLGLNDVGEKYSNQEYFIADLIVGGMLAKNILNFVQIPKLSSDKVKGKVVIGTIYEDIHDLGKNLMINALTAKGIEVIDLGVDVKVDAFIDAVEKYKPDILGVSCVMMQSVTYLNELGKKLEEKNYLKNGCYIIGGAIADKKYIKIDQANLITHNIHEGINFCIDHLLEKNGRGIK